MVDAEQDYGDLRWTVDTEQDLQVVRKLFDLLAERHNFSWQDVLTAWQAHPELQEINADVRHKSMFDVDLRAENHDQ